VGEKYTPPLMVGIDYRREFKKIKNNSLTNNNTLTIHDEKYL
jgi:hypothetical protein